MVPYSIAAVGRILLTITPFSRSGRICPHWVRVALFLAGPTGFFWSFVALTLLFFWPHLSCDAYFKLLHLKHVLGGIDIGILGLLFISGEFLKPFRRSSPPEP